MPEEERVPEVLLPEELCPDEYELLLLRVAVAALEGAGEELLATSVTREGVALRTGAAFLEGVTPAVPRPAMLLTPDVPDREPPEVRFTGTDAPWPPTAEPPVFALRGP